MYRHKSLAVLAIVALAFAAACGGGGGGGGGTPAGSGGGGGGTTVETNLHSVFYRTLDNAPVVQITLKRQNGQVITSNPINFDVRVDTTGNRVVPNTKGYLVPTDINGKAAVALPVGTYPLMIGSPDPTVVGNLRDKLTVSADMAKTYQTSQQQWIVNAPKNVSSLQITIYQTDASGNLDWGSELRPLVPVALATAVTVTAVGGATQVSFSTELFPGSYRALIFSTPTSTLDTIPTYISPVFTAAGGGATENQTHTLKPSGNILKLTLKEGANPVADGLYQLTVYDRQTRIMLGTSPTTSGVARVGTGDFTDVVGVVASGSQVYALSSYTSTSTHAADLVMYTIDGTIHPTSGSLETNDLDAVVFAKINSGLGDFFDKFVAAPIMTPNVAPIATNGTGAYQIKLFQGSYILSARNVNTFPDAQKVPLTVSELMTGQTINVSVGGVITGRVQDQAKNDISGVAIEIKDSTTNELIAVATSAANGSYAISVPYGTYNLFADGAVTRNLTVSSSNQTVTQNLTRFTLQGRLVDSAGGGLAGAVYWGAGNQAADILGTYTIYMMQGENWVWFLPPGSRPSIGFENTTVLVDSTTIASN